MATTIDPNFNVELQALATKYQVRIKGTAEPISEEIDNFNINAVPAVA